MIEEEIVIKEKNFLVDYVTRHLEAWFGVQIGSIISVKLGQAPKPSTGHSQDAVIVAKDENTGNVHLYVKTCQSHKKVVEQMFGIETMDGIGYTIIDSKDKEKSDRLFPIVKDFENVLKSRLEEEEESKRVLFSKWDNI